jgi:hypothetical protein
VAECRQLPVEHGADAITVFGEQQVVEPVVAMNQADAAVVRRRIGRQPVDERVHRGDRIGLRGAVLLRPARNLSFEIVARVAEVGEADGVDINGMQLCQHAIHLVVNSCAARVVDFRYRWIPEMSCANEFHDEEGRADHVLVLAQVQHARDGNIGFGERPHYPEFALDRVRGLQ